MAVKYDRKQVALKQNDSESTKGSGNFSSMHTNNCYQFGLIKSFRPDNNLRDIVSKNGYNAISLFIVM